MPILIEAILDLIWPKVERYQVYILRNIVLYRYWSKYSDIKLSSECNYWTISTKDLSYYLDKEIIHPYVSKYIRIVSVWITIYLILDTFQYIVAGNYLDSRGRVGLSTSSPVYARCYEKYIYPSFLEGSTEIERARDYLQQVILERE